MQNEFLSQLCDLYGAHINRGDFTVAGRIGVHPKLFQRLKAGRGCNVSTFNHVLSWFSENWPGDLEWPRDIPRPRKKKEAA
jgi:hypothetical protein